MGGERAPIRASCSYGILLVYALYSVYLCVTVWAPRAVCGCVEGA